MRLNPGKIGPLIQTVHEVTSAPARWLVVMLYVLEQPGDELQRFFGGDSLPLRGKASLEYAAPGKSLAVEDGLRLHKLDGGTEVTPSWQLEVIGS